MTGAPPLVSRGRARLAAALVLGLAAAHGAAAQGAPLLLRGVPASDALAAVSDALGVDVAFPAERVGDRPVWCGGRGWDASDYLRCVADAVGMDYVRRSSGTFVVVERVVDEGQAGAIVGDVVDAETGEPLPRAHVRLASATAVTDADGRFRLARVAPGPHVMLASYVGYQGGAVRVAVGPGETLRATVPLRPTVFREGTAVVSAFEARDASEVLGADGGYDVLPERVEARPAALRDGAPLAAGAPSVTSSASGPALRPLLGVGGRTFREGLTLQGGEPGELALTLDGARIYEPLSLGPALGAMSPLAVGRVTVHKAGFGAGAGSFLSGAVEAEHALRRPAAGPLDVAAEGDVYAASARVRGAAPLGRWRGEAVEAVALVAGRRSAWDVLRPASLDQALREWNAVDPVLAAALDGGVEPSAVAPGFVAHQHGSELGFSDLHAAARVRAGALGTVRASVYHGASSVETEVFALGAPAVGGGSAGTAFLARDAARWSNTAASLRADALVSGRWRLGGGLRRSGHRLSQRYDALQAADAGGSADLEAAEGRLRAELDGRAPVDNGNRLVEWTADLDASVAVAAGHDVRMALEATAVDGRFHMLSAGTDAAALRDLDAAYRRVRVAAVAEGRHRIGARWTAEPGLRITARGESGDVLAEPRLAVRYDALPGDRLAGLRLDGVAARLAVGAYRQFASRVELATFGPSALVPDVAVWLPADGTLPPPSALHAAGEVLWQPTAAWTARLEGYAKSTARVYAFDYDALFRPGDPLASQADFLRSEQGRSAGVGVRVERRARTWAGSAGVSLARADRRAEDRFGGAWVSAPWAEPLRATLGLDVLALGRRDAGLLLRARALGVWGRPWALRRAYYDVLPARGIDAFGGVGFGTPGADRLSPLLLVDAGVSYSGTVTGAQIEVAFDVANVLDRRNVLDWSLQPEAGGGARAVTRTLSGRQPSFRVRVSL